MTSDSSLELKSTINLPQTDFAQKGNLPQNEPTRLAHWAEIDLYGRLRAARAGSPVFVLHDGPPYANGRIHLGHVLNKVLKDFCVKSRSMMGYWSPYVPGWDCHGLPIEIKVEEELGAHKNEMPVIEIRRAARRHAEKYLSLQREDFKRLGILGEWDNPYQTMNSRYQAEIVRVFAEFVRRGAVYKGM
ncbi:MAG: isoleucine--tRNA ligase, partial [Acidobacteria bacterium]|nr:isoleucine--tRNA ligase [Acidobacteriota bacterium]